MEILNLIISVLIILAAHWISDFVTQPSSIQKIATDTYYSLGGHVGLYTVSIAVLCIPLLLIQHITLITYLGFILFNGAAHWGVDYMSCKALRINYLGRNLDKFLIIVGCDQAVHTAVLVSSFLFILTL